MVVIYAEKASLSLRKDKNHLILYHNYDNITIERWCCYDTDQTGIRFTKQLYRT